MNVKVYQDTHGNEPFEDWLGSIRDKRTLARIDSRLRRVRLGNLGDQRSVGDGVFELRLDFGPEISDLFWQDRSSSHFTPSRRR